MRDDEPYLLLTPGPLSTTRGVREAMLRDLSTWDVDYNRVVQSVRAQLVALATTTGASRYTCVLMQGSGTFAVEATLGSVIAEDGKLLLVSNGAYGARMVRIVERLGIAHTVLEWSETTPVDVPAVRGALAQDTRITHVAMVHCETTTGMLNPVAEIGALAREFAKVYVIDAMSSLGGIPLDAEALGAHYLVSSANKCIQGVPGFGFAICATADLARCEGRARSLSLDLFDQWRGMEDGGGKWRYTSPTHVLLAFAQALAELDEEGGVPVRYERYRENQTSLVRGMRELGFQTLLPDEHHSPIITSFHDPRDDGYDWMSFYDALKRRGFVIYPGKVSEADTFRIGTIGNVFPSDVERLLGAIRESAAELSLSVGL